MHYIALIAALVATPTNSITVATGVAAEALADTPTTDAINMEAGYATNQLSLTIAVTAGTSTRVQVTCYDSTDNVTYAQRTLCDAQATSDCVPDVREFTLADWATPSFSTTWHAPKKWIKCSADDPDDGTGTVTITATRGYR
jgi:hypothetical protein